jgi:uncharacterized protein (PEP-CTERM system associated)
MVNMPRLAPIALALLAIAPQSHAAWRLTPFIGLTETYTDNVALQPEPLARGQWVTEAAPGFSLVGNSPRLQVAAMAKWHYFAYSGQRQPNTADQQTQYGATAHARVVDDWLYLDAGASGGPQSVSAFGPQVTGNLWATGNRAEVNTWRISPYLRHRFGGDADLTVRFARDGVDAGRNLFGSSTATSELANLSSGPAWQTLGWSLDYSHQDLENKLAGPSSSEHAQGTVRYKLTRTFALTASTGYDRYDFQSLGGRMAGSNWSAGFIWAPSARTRIEASAGHRYFGPSGSLAASHRMRHSIWIANYSDAITTSRAQFLLPAAIDTASMLDKLFLASFPDALARQQAVQAYMQAAGLPQTLADSINYFSNRYMRQKQLQLAVGLNGAHGSWMLTAYDTRREALSVAQSDSQLLGSQLANVNADTRQRGVSSIYTYRMSSRTTALLTATASRSESLTSGLVQNARVVRLGMTHQMPDRMQLAVELRHSAGGAGALTTRTYTENAVSATFSIQL